MTVEKLMSAAPNVPVLHTATRKNMKMFRHEWRICKASLAAVHDAASASTAHHDPDAAHMQPVHVFRLSRPISDPPGMTFSDFALQYTLRQRKNGPSRGAAARRAVKPPSATDSSTTTTKPSPPPAAGATALPLPTTRRRGAPPPVTDPSESIEAFFN